MSIAAIVRQVITDAEEAGTSLSAATVEEIVYQDHSDAIDIEAEALVRSRVRSIAQDQLSAGTRNRQAALPGLEIPAWYSFRGEDGTVRFVPAKTATVAHLDGHIALRRENLENCRLELRQLIKIRRRCGEANLGVRLTVALS